ncbi:Metallo-dependent phosphatase-like protein [Xylaria sp. FL1042]|nr:Metallo-dependent phosphatase-like protein [Xylaria sp. FL1042]
MAPLKALQWAALTVPSLLAQLRFGAATTEAQYVLQPPNDPGSEPPLATSQRRLHGRFLHITDLHPDEHYKPHTSTEESIACHRGDGPAGAYGAETSDCDSPLSLVNATLAWVKEHLRDEIDFVVWTGDSARHDSDEELPRHNKDILDMNSRIADTFVETFSDEKGLVIPVVPTFGNNDIYPHNILMPGPNDVLQRYTSIWKPFIPEAQRHSFEFGGWFYVEVVPRKLAVFSLNTMYFFDRNAGIDDCAHPSEPGYKHFEWLRVQLDSLRSRGMKAILMGHVPPARTSGKQLWHETCWQKYTLWLQQYRDVIVGSLYGHMNIDHFLLQDTKEINLALIQALGSGSASVRETLGDELSIQSSAEYLRELRDHWATLPSPVALDNDVDETKKGRGKKGKKGKDKLGGKWAERFQLTLISPSVVPNYFPSIRVFEYNITGLEDIPTWAETTRTAHFDETPSNYDEASDVRELKRREVPDFEVEKKKKKKGKGKKGKKPPKDPNLVLPYPPAKGTPPGPAYYPQTLTLLGYTQYFANLTHINNDLVDPKGDDASSSGWNPGKHKGKTPKHGKPQPKKFHFEVEYSTFDDEIYRLDDLTVKNYVRLAHRIGQASKKAKSLDVGSEIDESLTTDDEGDDEIEEYDEDVDSDSDMWSFFKSGKKKNKNKHKKKKNKNKHKKKKNKNKHKKKKNKKAYKTWLHFLTHAFVSTKSTEELEDL